MPAPHALHSKMLAERTASRNVLSFILFYLFISARRSAIIYCTPRRTSTRFAVVAFHCPASSCPWWRTHTLIHTPRFVPRALVTHCTAPRGTRPSDPVAGYTGDAPSPAPPGGAYAATVLGQLAFTHVLNLARAATYPCSCSESEITCTGSRYRV